MHRGWTVLAPQMAYTWIIHVANLGRRHRDGMYGSYTHTHSYFLGRWHTYKIYGSYTFVLCPWQRHGWRVWMWIIHSTTHLPSSQSETQSWRDSLTPSSNRQAQNLQAAQAYIRPQRHAGRGGEREDRRGITGGSTGGRGGGVDLGAGRGGDAEADPAGHRGGTLASSGPPLAPRTPIRPARRAPDAHLSCKPLSKLTPSPPHATPPRQARDTPNCKESAEAGQESESPVRGKRREEGGSRRGEEESGNGSGSGERRNGMEGTQREKRGDRGGDVLWGR